MLERYSHQQLTWIDIVNPTAEEIRAAMEEADIPLTFTDDLTSMTPRTETIAEKGAVKITLDFPIVKRTDINHPHEVKFIATKHHLVTIRFEDIQAIDQFKKDFEVVSLLKRSNQKASGAHLLTTLLLRLYRGLDSKLDYLAGQLQTIDAALFDEREKEMVVEISRAGQRLTAFRQALGAHESALAELYTGIGVAFSKSNQEPVVRINEQYMHLLRRVDRQKQTLVELRETNNSLLTTKQNEVMKTLTIVAFTTFPLTLFASIFGMNAVNMPFIGESYDFWIIVSMMLVVSIGFFAYFKYKRWM
ncbi:MAG TPA: magnesium transporter CorA family protein [Candidatus Paceibacterota bacterium]|nr:magnesium transporter CorA family protein [Candidatus Paceibacterota bacterium]